MDSFFGIGPLELIFILIFALIFLGPERLPAAVRQVASFIRQIQKLSSTLTQQMGEEFGDIRELDPRYQLQQMIDEPDEKEKEAAKKAEEAKKKEEERKKEEARKAEEKRKAEAKKKADEARKKLEEEKKKAEEEAARLKESSQADAAAGQIESAATAESTVDAASQPQDASAQSAQDVASARAEARAAANALIPKTSENSIAPTALLAEAGARENGNDVATSAEKNANAVVEEEQA